MSKHIERYKVRARDPNQFEWIRKKLEGKTSIYVASRKRLTLSTGAIPADTRAEIERAGAEIAPELRYDLD
jgi:hypothetical protein